MSAHALGEGLPHVRPEIGTEVYRRLDRVTMGYAIACSVWIDPASGYARGVTDVTGCGSAERRQWLGLTALAAGVTKCADNNSEQSSKRSHEAVQGRVHKEHRRSRNGRDGGGRHDVLAYIGIKTGSFLLRGSALSRAPFLCSRQR